ncbi:helix-turn-helix domain-containing protein [Nitrolancea hollandica]|nr:helix-turn-helix transcriptional regulator [Nitrolancea hollandica]
MLPKELLEAYGEAEIIRRLMKRRYVNPDTGCWEWTGAKNSCGYGSLGLAGKHWYVHRLAAMIWLGLDPVSSLSVCHRCDIPACFNPAHQFLGTHADNIRDAYGKGRVDVPRRYGSTNGSSKLTELEVLAIRQLYAAGGISQRALGKRYKVSRTMISNIVSGKYWKHLPVAS